MDKENDILTEEKTDETPVYRRKNITVSDIITLQAILCVILSIAYMTLNMLFPRIAEEMYDEYRVNIRIEAEENTLKELAARVVEFINSTPRGYD